MSKSLKLAVLLSSFAVSAAFAQSTPPAQTPAAKAPTKSTQIAQGQAAPATGTAAGAQSTGVAATTTGAAAAGTGFAVPAAVAVGMTAVGAAAVNEGGNNASTTTHH